MSESANATVGTKNGETKAKHRKSIHDFGIGSMMRRLFNDGNYYTARVMTEPRSIFDVEKRKMVLSRKIKYYADDQEEWADEDQLNDWAYDGKGGQENETVSNMSNKSQEENNWMQKGNPEEEEDSDDSVLFGRPSRGSVRHESRRQQKSQRTSVTVTTNGKEKDDGDERVLFERHATSTVLHGSSRQRKTSNTHVAVTPVPSSEIAPRRLYSPETADLAKSSDTLPEMAGSSVAGSRADASEEDYGRRRSKRARRQTESFVASAALPPPPPPPTTDASGRKNPGIVKRKKDEIRSILMYKMGITMEEVDFALDNMSPPYGQNQAIHIIQTRRQEQGNMLREEENKSEKFHPYIGMRVRVPEGGSNYHGTVTDGPKYLIPENSKTKVKMWRVTFDDDEVKEDYDFNELFRYRASRPVVKFEDCRGRTLNALELFSGEGIVTQAFCKREFNVRSIDLDPNSYAMMVLDIRKAQYEDIGFVPDFIWASPPCTTCSNLTGGKHRNAKEGQFEKTQEAHDHNILFAQMICIMRWAKSKNPHLIVVIENPQAQMQKLPMMIEFEQIFGLFKATVDYCAFERPDKKPTNLWTNDRDLCARLSQFRCSNRTCPYHNQIHPIGVRTHHCFNSAAIPIKLAEEVAHYVDSKFYINGVAYTPKIELSPEEEADFNRRLSCKPNNRDM